MRRALSLLTLATLMLGLATSAQALGVKKGLKLGTGTSMFDVPDGAKEPDDEGPWAVGAAMVLDLPVISVEADLMYRNYKEGETRLGVPVLAKVSILPTPLLGLSLGAGLEPRWVLASRTDADNLESMVWYLPVSLDATFDLQVAKVGAEIRYEHQMTNEIKGSIGDDYRHHQLMLYGGIFF